MTGFIILDYIYNIIMCQKKKQNKTKLFYFYMSSSSIFLDAGLIWWVCMFALQIFIRFLYAKTCWRSTTSDAYMAISSSTAFVLFSRESYVRIYLFKRFEDVWRKKKNSTYKLILFLREKWIDDEWPMSYTHIIGSQLNWQNWIW